MSGAAEYQGGVVYEHIKVTSSSMEVCGEHIMADAGPLRLRTDFYGADEAITNYEPGRSDWVATLIITGVHRQDAWERRNHVILNLKTHFKTETYNDPS
ncbi:MAG: hypothetical protein GY950_17425 [bacterium]|nr:hypothetical protein [bacterium]